MDLNSLPNIALTGDILLVHGRRLEQEAIQIMTCSPFCHVALLIGDVGGPYTVAEFIEPDGFAHTPLPDWLASRDGEDIYFGQCPEIVAQNGLKIIGAIPQFEGKKYDFADLPLAWLSEITGQTYESTPHICSFFVEEMWRLAGFATSGNLPPGGFLKAAEYVSYINM